jgi:hypothetical protein
MKPHGEVYEAALKVKKEIEEKEAEDDKEKIIIENPETLKKLEEIAKELEAKKEEEKKKQEFSDNVFSGRRVKNWCRS